MTRVARRRYTVYLNSSSLFSLLFSIRVAWKSRLGAASIYVCVCGLAKSPIDGLGVTILENGRRGLVQVSAGAMVVALPSFTTRGAQTVGNQMKLVSSKNSQPPQRPLNHNHNNIKGAKYYVLCQAEASPTPEATSCSRVRET